MVGDTKEFEEAWKMFEARQNEVPENVQKVLRGVFMAGGYGCVGVLINRIAALPGAVDPGDLVAALTQTIETSFAELELHMNKDVPPSDKTFGSA